MSLKNIHPFDSHKEKGYVTHSCDIIIPDIIPLNVATKNYSDDRNSVWKRTGQRTTITQAVFIEQGWIKWSGTENINSVVHTSLRTCCTRSREPLVKQHNI